MSSPCKHPKVRIVSRQEDAEYVECLECGEVFDSDEFHDMAIEERAVQHREYDEDSETA
jgi:transcription initiation factor TFIIIB Brf1 subunit/transcription initiation factor TFIIB